MRVAAAATMVSSILVLAGCGTTAPASDSPSSSAPPSGSASTSTAAAPGSRSGIAGVVLLGPRCPVVQTPGPACPDQPAAGAAVSVRSPAAGSSGPVIASTRTDTSGHYHLELPPGTYVVVADAGMSCTPAPVEVTSAAVATVDITCDTGIR